MNSATSPLPAGTKTPRTFVRRLVWSVPLHLFVAITLVGGAAVYYNISVSNRGTWASLGGWSVTLLYVVLALIGGTLAGLLNAAQQVVTQVEFIFRELLHTMPPLRTVAEATGRPISKIRQEYEEVLNHTVNQASRRLRLPGWMERLIRSTLRGVVLDRFIASCTERGITIVPPQEFRNWLLAEGVSLGFMLVQDQLSWWRYLILGFLGSLVLLALALALLTI